MNKIPAPFFASHEVACQAELKAVFCHFNSIHNLVVTINRAQISSAPVKPAAEEVSQELPEVGHIAPLPLTVFSPPAEQQEPPGTPRREKSDLHPVWTISGQGRELCSPLLTQVLEPEAAGLNFVLGWGQGAGVIIYFLGLHPYPFLVRHFP